MKKCIKKDIQRLKRDLLRRSGRGYGVREFSTDLDELSREQIIEAHKISIIPTACLVQKLFQKLCVIFAKTTVDAKLDGSEFKTEA